LARAEAIFAVPRLVHLSTAKLDPQRRGFPAFRNLPELEENLQHIDPEHPPDEENRDDCTSDMDDPVAGGLRSAEIEHDGMVARGV